MSVAAPGVHYFCFCEILPVLQFDVSFWSNEFGIPRKQLNMIGVYALNISHWNYVDLVAAPEGNLCGCFSGLN